MERRQAIDAPDILPGPIVGDPLGPFSAAHVDNVSRSRSWANSGTPITGTGDPVHPDPDEGTGARMRETAPTGRESRHGRPG